MCFECFVALWVLKHKRPITATNHEAIIQAHFFHVCIRQHSATFHTEKRKQKWMLLPGISLCENWALSFVEREGVPRDQVDAKQQLLTSRVYTTFTSTTPWRLSFTTKKNVLNDLRCIWTPLKLCCVNRLDMRHNENLTERIVHWAIDSTNFVYNYYGFGLIVWYIFCSHLCLTIKCN